ncbi:MAG: hypothetical protein R3A46_16540 [Thermomicrobiales bacterium]
MSDRPDQTSKSDKSKRKPFDLGAAIVLGVGLGAVMGLALGNLALGVGIGISIGVAIGVALSEERKDKEHR